jgi:hypothetical protein
MPELTINSMVSAKNIAKQIPIMGSEYNREGLRGGPANLAQPIKNPRASRSVWGINLTN